MNLVPSLLGGLAGALTVTLVHELMKNTIEDAPRMDKLGMEAIDESLDAAGQPSPSQPTLFKAAFAGELISNTLYYALAGIGKRKTATRKGGLLGLAAGMGSIFLPKPLGLNSAHSNRTKKTQLLALGLYLLGGLVAAKVTAALDSAAEHD